MDGWRRFCYDPVMGAGSPPTYSTSSSFQWLVSGDFEMCFQYLAFTTASSALFGVLSIFYAGRYRTRYRRARRPLIVMVKLLLAVCMSIASVAEFGAAFWMDKRRPYAVLTAELVNGLSWAGHAVVIWVFSTSAAYKGRGPLLLNFSWYLTLIATILHFRSVIRWTQHRDSYQQHATPSDTYFTLLLRASACVHMGLQILYGLSFLPHVAETEKVDEARPLSRHRWRRESKTMSIQYRDDSDDDSEEEEEEEEGEKRPFLSLMVNTSLYGTVAGSERDDLNFDLSRINADEDAANPLSLLIFWWVWPLLRRGGMGCLETVEDLPQLPKSLKTSHARDKFRNVLLQRQQTSNSTCTLDQSQFVSSRVNEREQNEAVARIDPKLFFDSEVMMRSFTRSTPLPASCSPEPTTDSHAMGAGPSRDSAKPSKTADEKVARPTSLLFLFSALNRAFGWHYYPLGLLKFITDLLGFAGPLLLYQLVSFIENKKEPMFYGYLFALGLLSSTLVSAVLTTHFNYQVNKVGLKVRAALITEVYRKALSISLTTMSRYSVGQVVNFMSTDTDRIVNFCQSFHQFWSLPFQIAVSLYLLHQQVGLAFLAGVAFCILLVPVNRWLAVKIGQLSTSMMAQKDQRVKVISEVLAGIRVIKFYAWEKHFSSKIFQLRQRELKSLRGRKYLDALCVYFWATTPVLISILTFTTYVALGHHLTAAKVFTSVALFNILISPLNAFPWVINGLMEAWVSTKRVQLFLQLEEVDWRHYYIGYGDTLYMNDASFSWSSSGSAAEEDAGSERGREEGEREEEREGEREGEREEERERGERDGEERVERKQRRYVWTLSNITLNVPHGKLLGVTGKVGSGKSSLLAAITAEMKTTQGQVFVDNLDDGFGLVTQEAWIQQETVQNNILFGSDMQPAFYQQVVSACALQEDFSILPAGDRTEVGENGVTLSGGQKTRLSLARAVYQDKTVYLLDDPLAAVDAHVASHLYTHCIMGLLRHKTRILCTHHYRFLRDADWVLVMEEGRVDEQHSGPPDQVLPWLDQQHTNICTGPSVNGGDEHSREEGSGLEGGERRGERGRKVSTHTKPSERASTAALDSTIDPVSPAEQVSPSHPTGSGVGSSREHALVQEEEREVGVVAVSVYFAYWAAVGSILAPAIFLALFLMQASKNVSDWWLAYWISHSHDHPGVLLNTTSPHSTLHTTTPLTDYGSSNAALLYDGLGSGDHNTTVLREAGDNLQFYLGVYGGLAVANSVFTLFRAFLYAYGGVCAAKVLHKKLLRSILRAPTSFFDVTPIGRIVNRFSSDIYSIDDSLPFIMNILLAQAYGLLGTLVVTCYGLPWFTLMLVPLAVLYYYIQRFYRRTSRELKRLSSVTLSPVYAHFSETLSGVWTIRALRASERFMLQNQTRLDVNQRANYGSYVVAQWLGLHLQLLGVAMVGGVSFLAVLEHHFNTVDPGLVGLAISYALSVTGLLSGVVTSFTETEKQMVSVERAMQYITGAPTETDTGTTQPPTIWPTAGHIEFSNVTLSYREDHPLALDKVSFVAEAGEKIGVVGRTGAGKSSLLQALFRMVEISSGSILIDDRDTATIPLEKLRSVMAVIPQDPFLFSGTIRENLDPCSQYKDHELWSVLERCHLQRAVSNMGGLHLEVEERGRVFSVGQRQLVCLARALLRRSKVICIDEATANVDLQTDAHIQSTIAQEFKHCTVITIAHRIKTILQYDKVLVMEQGRVMEYGAPSLLLQQTNSLFLALYTEHNR